MTVRPGSYVLVMRFDSPVTVTVGALGEVNLKAATYAYVGSALSGLDQRLARHFRRDKCMKWHIDRLTSVADCVEAFEFHGTRMPECALAARLRDLGAEEAVPGFGCSDCRCHTHLFLLGDGSQTAFLESSCDSVFPSGIDKASAGGSHSIDS